MDGADSQERTARAARRWVARPLWVAGLAALAATLSSASASGPATGDGRAPAASGGTSAATSGSTAAASGGSDTASCPTPAQPPHYPDVAPIFERHCAKCHDARQSDNAAAQAVFEMTSYPFSTKRPATLLADLRAMIPRRGALSADEKCRGLQWLTAGGLDAAGTPPHWR
jgi:hypothetical protein